MHLSKRARNLHQLPQLNRSAEKARRCNDKRKNNRGLPKETGKPDQVLLCFDECQIVTDNGYKPRIELVSFNAFTFVQGNRFAVFTHAHHVVAEVCFVLLLEKVQADLRFTNVVRQHTANEAIHHSRPQHVTWNGVAAAAQGKRKCARESPKNTHKTHQSDHGIEQTHAQRNRLRGELVHVFRYPLVGIVSINGGIDGILVSTSRFCKTR